MSELDPQNIGQLITGLVAIISSVVTILLTHFLQFSGKISISIDWLDIYMYSDVSGASREVDNFSDSKSISFYFNMSIWNSAIVPKWLRLPTIKIKSTKTREILEIPVQILKRIDDIKLPYDSSSKPLWVINLPSREAIEYKFNFKVEEKYYHILAGEAEFFLKAKIGKSRRYNFSRKLMTKDFNSRC